MESEPGLKTPRTGRDVMKLALCPNLVLHYWDSRPTPHPWNKVAGIARHPALPASAIQAVHKRAMLGADHGEPIAISYSIRYDCRLQHRFQLSLMAIAGFPDMALASTSYIERLNGRTLLRMCRLVRLTYAFSKKRENC